MAILGSILGWQAAIILDGAIGLILFAILWSGSGTFRHSTHERGIGAENQETPENSFSTVLAGPVLLCWAFFFIVAMGQMGMMTFVPTLMSEIYNFDLEQGGVFVSVMIGAVMTGVLFGGYLADNFRKPDLIVTVGYLIATFLAASLWYFSFVIWQLYVVFAIIGFMYGVVFPSRELLVRAATPKGASGRVFGFVYSGMDFGAAITPVLFGWYVDMGVPRYAFLCVAILWATSVILMLMTNAATIRRSRMVKN